MSMSVAYPTAILTDKWQCSGRPLGCGDLGLPVARTQTPTLAADRTDITGSGTGETLPFSCFRTETERSAYNARLLDLATNASDTSIGEAWSIAEWMTAYCKNSTDALEADELIGTVYTARDMTQIVDALGEDDMLRYWGEQIVDTSTLDTELIDSDRHLIRNCAWRNSGCNVPRASR